MGKFTLKKSLKRYTANVLNFLLLFSLIVPNVLSPAIVIAQDLDIEQEESITEIPTIPIDESEDILEEGISTSTFEEGIYTVSLVEEKEYVYPEDDRVRIRFTSITEEGDLTIKKVILTEEEKLTLNTTDEYAWDFTSTMSNGSFTYDLVLPNNQGEEIEVKYSEDGSTYTPIDEVLVNEGIVKISGLDHFTTFVITGIAGSIEDDSSATKGWQKVLPPDKTPPSNEIKNILVSRDNGLTYSESEFINKGDFVKVQVEAIDDLSGIKNVQFRIQDKVSGAYVAPIGYINTTISENIYEYTFQVPTDGKYINTHGPISQIFEQISVWARATDLAENYNHGTTDYITYDNTQPTISMPKMLVSEDGINFTERNYVKPGDTIKIQAIASDSSSGIESVEFRITDKDTNEYIAPRTFVETAVNSEGLYEFIFSIPNDLKYINTHNPISQEPFQLSYFVRSHDNAGNYAHGQKDFFTLDTTAPSQPTGLMRKDLEGTVYQCGDIAQLQTLIPDWDDNTEADFSHYEYTSFHPNGSIGINEQKLYSSEFLHNWVPATEGIYGYAVRAVDLAGNKSPWSLSGKTLEGSCQITYDSTGPVAPSIVFPSEGQYFNSTPILNDWTEVSDPSGIKEYRIEYIYDDGHTFSGGPYRTTTSSQRNHTPSLSEQGGVTIRVQAIDKVGNEGAWSNPVHYYYDKTGPEILFGGLRYINSTTVDTSNINTNDNTPIIFFTASDTLGTVVEASVNGYSATYDGSYWVAEITSPLPEGKNSLSIKAKDNAGNESQITHDIFVDTKAPFAQYTYYKDGEEILSSTAYVQEVSQLSFLGQYMDDHPSSGILKDSYVIFDSNLLGTARTSKAYCGWRGTGNTVEIPYTEKVLFTNCEPTLPDGQYFMYHQVYDNAVRKDIPTITQFRDVKGLHFVVDTIAPVVEITSPSENDSLSGEVIIQGNVKDQNLSHYNISIYDGDADVNDFSKRLLQNTEYTTEFDTKNLLTWDTTEFDNGEYQIRLAARDLAGNRDDDTSIQVIKVIVDNTPPTTEQPTQNEGEVQGVTTGSNTTTNSPTLAKKVTTFIADILGVGGEGDVLALEEDEETLEDDTEEVKGSQTCDNPSTISGYIYIDSNENGEKDEKERVFPEISIRIYTITEGMEETVKQIVSDENGYWETTLCSGDYYISVDDSKLPNNYVLGENDKEISLEEDKDSTLNFEVLDERNFLQKYWPWILLAVGILGSIGIVAVDTRRKKEYI